MAAGINMAAKIDSSDYEDLCVLFEQFDFDKSASFQDGWTRIKKKMSAREAEEKILDAKLFYFSKFVQPLSKDVYTAWSKSRGSHQSPPALVKAANALHQSVGEKQDDFTVSQSSVKSSVQVKDTSDTKVPNDTMSMIRNEISSARGLETSTLGREQSSDTMMKSEINCIGGLEPSTLGREQSSDTMMKSEINCIRGLEPSTLGREQSSDTTMKSEINCIRGFESSIKGEGQSSGTIITSESNINTTLEPPSEEGQDSHGTHAMGTTNCSRGLGSSKECEMQTSDSNTTTEIDYSRRLESSGEQALVETSESRISEDHSDRENKALHVADDSETPQYPTSFMEIMRLVQEGKDIPGMCELDIVPTNTLPTPSLKPKPKKPWQQ